MLPPALPLELPLTPDPAWADFLAARRDALDAVHLGLGHPALADARQRIAPPDLAAAHAAIDRVAGTDVFVLMNSRLHDPAKYASAPALNTAADLLDALGEHPNVRGLVFADPYFLQALSDARPATAARYEAVPSVNAGLDSAPKALALLALIDTTAFRPPSRLVLDRALNRDMDRLAQTSARLRAARPGLKLLLMANEGCLLHCPYKPAHDAHVSLVTEGMAPDRTFATNRDLGCVRRFLADPGAVLASPFIRPEDAGRYAGLADGLKLCGRNRGTPFLRRAAGAYLAGSYPGNLLDLLDTLGDLAGHLRVPGDALPPDFAARVEACGKDCRACGWCGALMARIAVRTDPGLPRLRVPFCPGLP
ncbi:MAG: hypothetical protein V3571_03290 [Pseudodesulfovibrio sp.]